MVPIEVLHVDDSEAATTTAEILERENRRFEVDTARTVSGALDRLDSNDDRPEVDCVVSGYEIPGADGLTLLEAVRGEYPDLPFVLFTGRSSEDLARAAIARGVDGYLEKRSATDQYALLANRIEANAERYRANERVERLHEATRAFMRAPDRAGVCEAAIDAIGGILGFPLSTVWLLEKGEDDAATRKALQPVAVSEGAREEFEDIPTYEPGEGLSWEAFESGETVFYRDVDEQPGAYDPDTPVRSELILPLGDHGVMNVGSTRRREIDDIDRSLADLLAANVEAALDRAAREEAHVRSERELERQNERLEEFVGVVSHDLRNPLHVAEARLEYAARESDSEHIEVAADAIGRMDALLEDLLTLAREGDTVEEAQPVSLRSVADDAWEGVDATDATLAVQTDATIRAEPRRLVRLLGNLFRNAAEHAREDGKDSGLTVTFGDLPGGFVVEDDGVGIPPDERDRIFESGYSTSTEGTGFGLSIVRRIAEAHDWEVTPAAGEDGGARFEFTGVDRIEE